MDIREFCILVWSRHKDEPPACGPWGGYHVTAGPTSPKSCNCSISDGASTGEDIFVKTSPTSLIFGSLHWPFRFYQRVLKATFLVPFSLQGNFYSNGPSIGNLLVKRPSYLMNSLYRWLFAIYLVYCCS